MPKKRKPSYPLLRLVSAVLIELSEDWETGKVYLNIETE